MSQSLSFLMPSLSPSPGLTPRQEVPRRSCLDALTDPAKRHPGGQVHLGWPVLLSCRARSHNTLYAARRRGALRCTCPRAVELKAEHKERDRIAKRARLASTPTPALSTARTPTGRVARVEPVVVMLPRSEGVMVPACRAASLGGSLTEERLADFFDDTQGISGDLARERARTICRQCPIQAACLRDAVRRGEPYGVMGGLDARERRNDVRVRIELMRVQEVTE
jgi:hypothetical protein